MSKRGKMLKNSSKQIAVEAGIVEVTSALPQYVAKNLKKHVSLDNLLAVINYVRTMEQEVHPSVNYRLNTIIELQLFCKFQDNKDFSEIERVDVIRYLDSYKKSEAADPMHKWIGTWNNKLVKLARFFKWYYNPKLTVEQRDAADKPEVIDRISQIKRKEESIYKPDDLWTVEADLLFVKYCPSKRDRCYHIMSKDTSCRPDELLKLKVKDIQWHNEDGKQYGTILVSGKTGSRSLPLIDCLPYLKEWLSVHPQKGNGEAYLFPSMKHQSLYTKLSVTGLNLMYRRYKDKLFPHLLTLDTVPDADKESIRKLLTKPWNPYVRRHSGLTEKSTILKDGSLLRQYGGWTARSMMSAKYVHYFSDESSKTLLEAKGIISSNKDKAKMKLSKTCPSCQQENSIDAQWCENKTCNMMLSITALKRQQEREKIMKDVMQLIIYYRTEQDPQKKAELAKKMIAAGYPPLDMPMTEANLSLMG